MVSARAVGDLKLFFRDRYVILKNVLYVPQMRRTLDDDGFGGESRDSHIGFDTEGTRRIQA